MRISPPVNVTTASVMTTGGFSRDRSRLALTLIAAGATIFEAIASAAITLAAMWRHHLGFTTASVHGRRSVVLLGLGLALISRGTRRSARTHKGTQGAM
jgi:hypothetical protein